MLERHLQELLTRYSDYLCFLKNMGFSTIPASALPGIVSPGDSDRVLQLITLDDVIRRLGDCRRCKLHETRTNIVFGSGSEKAKLVFVGEGPGYDEDVQGEPFVGAAGQLLTRILEAINLRREEVYICNIVKCRPPGNRRPERDEIAACSPFLFEQLEIIGPKLICALGSVAAQVLLKTSSPIGQLRGRFHEFRDAKLMPTYHPAYLLRNPSKKREVWNDIQMIQREYAS